MTMTEQQNRLFREWREDRPGMVTDGVVDESAYLNSKIRILYLLKEVNGGMDWDLCQFVASGGRAQTWDNITRWTYGIRNLEQDIRWEALSSISEEQRKEVLKSICVVNVKKLSGGHTSDLKQIHGAARQDSQRLKAQLSIYHPDLIICCGTDGVYFNEIYQYQPEWKMTSRGIWYVKEPDRIVMSYSHPEARVRDCLLYYGLVDAVREILNTKTE